MRLVYQPDGQPEPQIWPIHLGKLRSLDVEAIERLTGLDYGTDYKAKLLRGNSLARRALLFVLQRRDHPTLKFSSLDFADDEVRLEFDLDELQAMRQGVAESAAVPETERPAVLAEIDRQIAEEERRSDSDSGKALMLSAEPATG